MRPDTVTVLKFRKTVDKIQLELTEVLSANQNQIY